LGVNTGKIRYRTGEGKGINQVSEKKKRSGKEFPPLPFIKDKLPTQRSPRKKNEKNRMGWWVPHTACTRKEDKS